MLDDIPDTGTARTRAAQAHEPGTHSSENAIDLAAIKATLSAADRTAAIWRGLGSLAATVAITIAGWALSLAQQAAVDHVRVERLEAVESGRADRIERLVEEQGRQRAVLEQMQETLREVREDLRDLARRNPSEERGPR